MLCFHLPLLAIRKQYQGPERLDVENMGIVLFSITFIFIITSGASYICVGMQVKRCEKQP